MLITCAYLFSRSTFLFDSRLVFSLVLVVGLEPTRLSATDFESASSAYSDTPANVVNTAPMG